MESGVKREQPDEGDDLLTLLRGQFEEYADIMLAARHEWEKCRRYRDGDQWDKKDREKLEKRKQPCITDNKIQDKCDTLLGIEKQMRTDPKAYPRTPNDEQSAEAATDALRYIADSSDYHRTTRKPAADNLMVEGICAGQVIVEKRKPYPKVCMEHIRQDRVFFDIHSLAEDFSDKSYCGYFTWMDFEQAKLDWKDKLDALEGSFADSGMSVAGDKSLDDKPRYTTSSRGRKRLQVFTHYFKHQGQWKHAKWCKGGFLEAPTVSTYKTEDGEPDCPIELQAQYRQGEDGAPYGLVRRYLDLQDEHNKRRSKMLHLLNTKRIIAQKGAFEDVNKARAELHKPDGVLETTYPIDQVRIESNLQEAEGQWRLLQQTEMALAATGPNAALAGQSGDLSGRAKQLDQQSGTLPISPLFDALDAWEVRMYRQAWLRVRQFWNGEMWIRVTDDENKMKFVGLNQQVLEGDLLAQQLKSQPIAPEEKMAILQEIAQDPMAQQPAIRNGQMMKKNEVAKMCVDIIIDRSPDVVTVQQEQFEILAGLADKRPEIPFDVLVEMSQLRSETKRRILDRLKGADDPAAQQMAQMQQMMADLQARLQQQELALKAAQTDKTDAEADKIRAETVNSQVSAITNVAQATTPEPVALQ